MGIGADGRFRRLEVDLCIMWLAIAVTVSLLSLPPRGSDPHYFSYLQLRPNFSPFSSRNHPSLVNCGIGNEKGDSLVFLFFFYFNQLQSSCKEAIFSVSSNHSWDLISRHATVQ